jgi:hypothetical protein
MEEVYPVALMTGITGGGVSSGPGMARSDGTRTGRIVRVLTEGRYLVLLPDATRVEVSGPAGLKPEQAVRVVSRSGVSPSNGGSPDGAARGFEDTGFQGPTAVLMPLMFGGPGARARLDVYLPPEGRRRGVRPKGRVVLFVFDVKTRALGRIQWGVHLSGKELALQIWAEEAPKAAVRGLAGRVESALVGRGFALSSPTMYLSRPVPVPSGSLNVRG